MINVYKIIFLCIDFLFGVKRVIIKKSGTYASNGLEAILEIMLTGLGTIRLLLGESHKKIFSFGLQLVQIIERHPGIAVKNFILE